MRSFAELFPFRLGASLRPKRIVRTGDPRRDSAPDWVRANPNRIEAALARTLELPTGGWFAVDASRRFGEEPVAYTVAGRELVFWRCQDGDILVAPDACPHMGAKLSGARRRGDCIVCPWHGLELGPAGHGRWRPVKAHDDGVLVWVQLLTRDDEPTDAPILTKRPVSYLEGVIRVEAECEPRDVIQNRLDPWHGAHFHPYSFGDLEVIGEDEEKLVVRVSKKLLGAVHVEVVAKFDCPDARTIVMTILEGEGAGSVVETHATPLDAGQSAIVEATLATSDRPGFKLVTGLGRYIRPFIERSAARLWVDDAEYAERLYRLRSSGWTRGRTAGGEQGASRLHA